MSNNQLGDLNDLRAFARVAQLRSFRKAAQELQLTASALSHTMRKLEQELGVRLLNRTTRSVSPTEAGEKLLLRLMPAFGDIKCALDGLNEQRARPAGHLRLNVPRMASQLVFGPKIAAWQVSFPDIQLELVTNDALVDIVAEGFDAGVRFGEQLQQDMVAVPIGPPIRFSVCAAPTYLAKHGKPEKPADLLRHNCMQLRFPSGVHYKWEFEQNSQQLEVATRGTLISDDFYLLLQAALDGAGICYIYDALAAPLVQSGQLEYVLQDWHPKAEYFNLYYPSGRNMRTALRALIDFFK
jgi:DNA-binding transcriptional LysR family regulator